MSQFFATPESMVLVLTLVFTVYFSYRSMRIQQQTLSIKSAEEFSEKDLTKQSELEIQINTSIYHENGDITDKFIELNKDHLNRLKLIGYLNLYEGLARGINMKIYDESIFIMTRKSTTIKTFYIFQGFIYDYRLRYNRPNAWSGFEKLVKRWEKI